MLEEFNEFLIIYLGEKRGGALLHVNVWGYILVSLNSRIVLLLLIIIIIIIYQVFHVKTVQTPVITIVSELMKML